MAKKRKKSKTTYRRRSRVGAVSGKIGHEAMELAGLVAGNVAAVVIQKQAMSLNPKIVAGLQIVGGYMLKKHTSSPLMSGISYGLMSAGAIAFTHEIGLINGIEETVSGLYNGGVYTQELDTSEMQGISNGNTMSGMSNGTTMSGNGSADMIYGMM